MIIFFIYKFIIPNGNILSKYYDYLPNAESI